MLQDVQLTADLYPRILLTFVPGVHQMLQDVQLTTGQYPHILLTVACAIYFNILYWILLVNLRDRCSYGIMNGVGWKLVTAV